MIPMHNPPNALAIKPNFVTPPFVPYTEKMNHRTFNNAQCQSFWILQLRWTAIMTHDIFRLYYGLCWYQLRMNTNRTCISLRQLDLQDLALDFRCSQKLNILRKHEEQPFQHNVAASCMTMKALHQPALPLSSLEYRLSCQRTSSVADSPF